MERPEAEARVGRFVEYWDALSPDEQTALRDEARKKVDAQMADRDEDAESGGGNGA